MLTHEIRLRLATDLAVALLMSPHNLKRIQSETADGLMRECYQAITNASIEAMGAAPRTLTQKEIDRSIATDYLISFEDGKKYKGLTRHLTARGLTADQYRQKWGLPENYPMVCEKFGSFRSNLAKSKGLGKKPATA